MQKTYKNLDRNVCRWVQRVLERIQAHEQFEGNG